ncbi:MAG: hypothetical protein AAFU50_09695, partial [Pseudomonadota bacterium]
STLECACPYSELVVDLQCHAFSPVPMSRISASILCMAFDPALYPTLCYATVLRAVHWLIATSHHGRDCRFAVTSLGNGRAS